MRVSRFAEDALAHVGKRETGLPNSEVFCSLQDAEIVIARWRHHCNTIWPHRAIGNLVSATHYLTTGKPASPSSDEAEFCSQARSKVVGVEKLSFKSV
ncbi:MAG: hypothetical protein WEC00_12860 [Dongiaceae bacterium]